MSGEVELGRAYAAYRDRESPSAEERITTWETIQTRIARGETGPALTGPPPALPPRRVGTKTVAAAVLIAAAAVVAIALPTAQVLTGFSTDDGRVEAPFQSSAEGEGGEAIVVDDVEIVVEPRRTRPKKKPRERPPELEAVELEAPVPASVEPPPLIEELPPPEEPAPEPVVERKRRVKPPRPEPVEPVEPPAPEPPPPPALQVQAKLLQQARTALARHQPKVALAAVREHARRFPETSFARERAALELLAQCELGRAAAVHTRVDAFLSRNAGTALADRVDRACRR